MARVTVPGVPLAAVVPAAPPAAGSRRPGRDLRGGSGLDGGSGARGYPLSTAEPGSTTIYPRGRRTTGPGGAVPSHGNRGSRRGCPGAPSRCHLVIPAPAASAPRPGMGSSFQQSRTHAPSCPIAPGHVSTQCTTSPTHHPRDRCSPAAGAPCTGTAGTRARASASYPNPARRAGVATHYQIGLTRQDVREL